MLYLILIIIVLSILLSHKKETYTNQFCKLSNFDNKVKFMPINMILNDIKPFKLTRDKESIDSNIVLSIKELEQAVNDIKINKKKYNFKQIAGIKYNLVDPPVKNVISSKYSTKLPKMVFKLLKESIDKQLSQKTNNCNGNTPCDLILKDSRLLKFGKYKSKFALEGQLLLSIKHRNMDMLFRYVASDIDDLSIHYLKLEGYDISKFSNNLKYDYVNIYKEPIVNTYRANKTYLTSSNENKLTDVKLKPKLDENLTYRCYGKSEFNKVDCEKKFDSNGKKQSIIGIWDKPCVKNTDCPFFRANKNFKNNLGGCINNVCQMPIGIKTNGPTKHKPLKFAVCSNCKSGVNCCVEQKNRKLYPKLKSPDYRYPDDNSLRMDNKL